MADWKKTLGDLAPVIGSIFGPMGTAGGVLIKEMLGLSKDASDDDINLALLNPENQLKIKQMEYDYKNKLLESDTQVAVAQNEVNKVEAASNNLFVAGWRPACGWVCVTALGYHYIVQPFMLFILAIFKIQVVLPTFDMYSLITILTGILGLSAFRTTEKIKGV